MGNRWGNSGNSVRLYFGGLQNHWAIQTILRRENYPNPYETLKALTRTGAGINHEVIADFIETLEVSESVKEELRVITPWTYTGF